MTECGRFSPYAATPVCLFPNHERQVTAQIRTWQTDSKYELTKGQETIRTGICTSLIECLEGSDSSTDQ